MIRTILYCLFVLILHSGCGTIKESASHGLTGGVYQFKSSKHEKSIVYVQVNENELKLYPAASKKGSFDSICFFQIPMNHDITDGSLSTVQLTKHSWDVDLITVVFKYRFPTPSLPQQFSSHLNGGLYMGRKWESFQFRTRTNPIGRTVNKIHYTTFDAGIMVGLGSTPINPFVTRNHIETEYDGLVFQKGIAFFGGISRFTFGLGIGFDTLLDTNRSYWIYQEKPWIGLMVGINLTE